MKFYLALFLFLSSSVTLATCNVTSPEVRALVTNEIKAKTDADLTKAIWMNNFKSETYSVFVVQFKRHDNLLNDDRVFTFSITVSCSPLGTPMVDSLMEWNFALGHLPNI